MVTSVTVGIVFGILASIIVFAGFVLYINLPLYRKYYYNDEMKLTFLQQCKEAVKTDFDSACVAVTIGCGVLVAMASGVFTACIQCDIRETQKQILIAEHRKAKCTSCEYYLAYNEYTCKWDENGNMIKIPKYIFKYCPKIEKQLETK